MESITQRLREADESDVESVQQELFRFVERSVNRRVDAELTRASVTWKNLFFLQAYRCAVILQAYRYAVSKFQYLANPSIGGISRYAKKGREHAS